MTRVLILAGTAEARALAGLLASEPGIETTASLAGVTSEPAAYPVPVITGGFGGAAGLAAHLRARAADVLVDATHPFAAGISANAAEAARQAGCALLRLVRPPWQAGPGDRWIDAEDAGAAARLLPPGARAFLATGPGSLGPFAARRDVALILRAIEPVAAPPGHPDLTVVLARPPFALEDETATFTAHGISHLVSKNAGGAAGAAKLAAARALGLAVVMIARPEEPEAGARVASAEAARDWLRANVAGAPSQGRKLS